MAAIPRHSLYRSLLVLYPKNFRAGYVEDLVQHFGDLVVNKGAATAWGRTAVDLLVTVPRYRLESIMNERRSAATISLILTLLVAAGAMSLMTGFGPGLALVLVALIIGVAQRGTLAHAIRTPDSDRRRRRLMTSAILGLIFAVSVASYLVAVSKPEVSGASLVIHNAIGVPAGVGALIFLVIGLATPRSSRNLRASAVAP